MASQELRVQLSHLSQQATVYLQRLRNNKMQSDSVQSSFNEHNNRLLNEAISFWEASQEGQKLNEAFKKGLNDGSRTITKIFAFGLPSFPVLPEVDQDQTSWKFEDLDAARRLAYLDYAALLSLRKSLHPATGGVVEIEAHSFNYTPTTQSFLQSKQLLVHASCASPAQLDELASHVDEETLVFAPQTNVQLRMYIKCKARELPAAIIWRPAETTGLDAETWTMGPGDRWCSTVEMVKEVYNKMLYVELSDLGAYEVLVMKDN